jgi:hypothetical protein
MQLSKRKFSVLLVKNEVCLDSCLSPCTNINSKCIKDLNTSPETLKLVQERVGNMLEHIGIGNKGIGNNFLNRTPMTQQLRKN